jgi:CubicO group peptidase (beta-lactamase class C family)
VDLSTQIEARGATYHLAGTYAPEYRAVVDAFVENFRVEDEVGAACSIVLDGSTVIDVWGGWRDRALREPWDAPTTVCMMSVAKGITAICFNMLIDRGLVDPNARVTEYWPEYGRNGKEKTLVRHFLDHTAAVPVLTTNPLWPGAMFDREAMVKALEEQEPLWEIGTKAAYHVHHQGFLLGEIMRRVAGKTVGPFLRDEVAGPLHAEYYIGGMTDGAGARRRGHAEHGCAALRREGRRRSDVAAGARFQAEPQRALGRHDEQTRVAHRRDRERQRPR